MYKRRWQWWYIVCLKWKDQSRKSRVCMGYLAGMIWAFFVACRYAKFSSGLGIQMIEPWVLVTNYWADILLLQIAFLAVISDAPFVDNLSQSIMLRCRNKWVWNYSMILYILIHSVTYWTMIVGASILPAFLVKHDCFNQWSNTMKILIQAVPSNALTQYRLNLFSVNLLYERTPYAAAIWSFFLNVLCSGTVGIFVYFINLKTKKSWGNVVVLLIMLYGVLIVRDGGMVGLPYDFSIIAHVIVDLHGKNRLSLRDSMVLFILLDLIFILGIKKSTRNCDYREVNGNRIW